MSIFNALTAHYPLVKWHCSGEEIYANIIRDSGDPLPTESALTAWVLLDTKALKVIELSKASRGAIIAGFSSSALESEHHYDGEEVDQLNLVGSFSASSPTPSNPDGYSLPFAVREVVNQVIGPKQYKLHTHAQLKIVILDGAQFKLSKLQRFNDMRDYVNNTVLTIEKIAAVNWDMVFPIPA